MSAPCGRAGCSRPAKTRGFCGTHYEYARRRRQFDGIPAGVPPLVRYESKVDRAGGPEACHPWTGTLNEHGYGQIRVEGIMYLSHRWAYTQYVGPIGPKEVVRHTCDNPACQNRAHWLKGTQADNIRDREERGRGRWAHGESHHSAKLTPEDVLAIRQSTELSVVLARRYGMSTSALLAAKNGQTWKHLPMAAAS